jgi:glycosidase
MSTTTTSSWITDAVIYQINPRSICYREPRNAIEAFCEQAQTVSPYAYLTEHLSVLQEFGVTVLHLMPPFEMGHAERKGIGSPYAARDYYTVDPEHGTMEELKTLIRRARQMGFRVIIGMVPNHSSRDHVWIESHPEYFVQDQQGQITYDLDWSDTAKLNYKQPGLRQAMYEVYDHWLGVLGDGEGVDGFRIDMAHFINDVTFWDDTIAPLRAKYADRELLFMAECYGIDASMDLFRRGFNASYDDAFYKLLEHYVGVDTAHQSFVFRPGLHPENTTHSPHFEVFKQAGYAGAVRDLFDTYAKLVPQAPHPAYFARYVDNHDEGRSLYRFGAGAVQAMSLLTYCTPFGMPFLYTGQEFGAVNRPPIHERFGLCDKGCQMTNGSDIWRKEGIEFEGNSFARGFGARQEWMQGYRALMALRRAHPCLRDGDFRWIDVGEVGPAPTHTMVAFERSDAAETLTVVINLGQQPRTFSQTEWLAGEVVHGTRPEGQTLDAFSGVVLRQRG